MLRESAKKYKRIVIKIGSSLFCTDKEGFNLDIFNRITAQVTTLLSLNHEVVIVSSGAIALGMQLLRIKSRPKELPLLQAAAAVGQNLLMDNYSAVFKKQEFSCAQILLTWDDFNTRQRYLNIKNTLHALLELKSIPVINENDTVSTEEIRFGDNDQLSARVASLINADLLIMLSDVDGLLNREKETIPIVKKVDSYIKSLACPTSKKSCVGGMITKIEAASICVNSGIPCVIANGNTSNIILSVAQNPQSHGTLFLPKESKLASKKRWIAYGTKTKGKIVVDDGAKKALMNKKSLLSVGIIGVKGDFNEGDIISIVDKDGLEFAKGKVGISSSEIEKNKGIRLSKEVLHCDNIVLL